MKINLNQLYTFFTVVQHGGVRAAARVLHVSPSAVSMQLRRLEHWLDFPLITYADARVELSAQGKKLFPMVEKLFLQANIVDQAIDAMISQQQDVLRIGVYVAPAEFYMPTLLTILSQTMPHIDVRLDILDFKGTVQKLRSGDIHIGILGGEFMQDFQYKEFVTSEVVFAVCSKNPLALQKSISMQDLAQIPLLLQPKNASFAMHVQKFLAIHQVIPQKCMENISGVMPKKLLPGSLYGAFFDKRTIEKEIQQRIVCTIPLEQQIPPITLYYACLKTQAQQGTIRYLWENLPSMEGCQYVLQKQNT